ncbi:MAG TPA: dihydrolipoamide acetyltransferase family protein [Woeseiaceae bacterium]|nr:dihydrolipoamide acetyltransferase family protein [Woeseiaceae bacterium]
MSEYIFKLPDLGEGTVESEIGEWFVKVGDEVKEEDIVGTVMTDKAAVEVSSPVSGKIVKLAGEPGDIIAVGAMLVVIDTVGTADEGRTTGAGESAAVPEEVPAPPAEIPVEPEVAVAAAAGTDVASARIVTSPAIRRRAKEANIDLALVPGSGPGGRIVRKDFDRYLKARATGASIATPAMPSARVKEIKIIGVRRIIAERMQSAKLEIPHFAYVEEIDITELESLRKHLNSKNDESAKLTVLPFLGLALIRALRDFPQCNVTHDKDRNLLLQHEAVHVGIATQTPDGLKVPVIRHAEMMSLDGLAAEIRRLSEAARTNKAKREELSGSTITITSLGKLGGIASTPVINAPEVAIIGVNRAVERPVVLNGQVQVRLMMNLSSSFDHRFVDGYDAAAMIQRIKELLEHPATIFLP